MSADVNNRYWYLPSRYRELIAQVRELGCLVDDGGAPLTEKGWSNYDQISQLFDEANTISLEQELDIQENIKSVHGLLGVDTEITLHEDREKAGPPDLSDIERPPFDDEPRS
jgi:hypothetical protein